MQVLCPDQPLGFPTIMPNHVYVCSFLHALAICESHTVTETCAEKQSDFHVDYVFFSCIVGSEKFPDVSGFKEELIDNRNFLC